MYTSLKSLLDKFAGQNLEIIELSLEDDRLAIAVLYYRVILIDGQIRLEELDRFREILSSSLKVSEDELQLFEDTVVEKINSDNTIFPLLDNLRELPIERRYAILADMHEISISDKELHEFEINLVYRAGELLGLDVSQIDMIAQGRPFQNTSN